MHYITDLTQPYHATVVPGLSTGYMLWVNLIAMLGWTGPKERAIQLVSNRHTALEEFQMQMMQRAYRSEAPEKNPVIAATERSAADANVPPYDDRYIEDVITKQSYGQSGAIDEALTAYLPEHFVSDPDYRFPPAERDQVYDEVVKNRKDAVEKMNAALVELFESFGVHARSYARYVLAQRKAAPAK